MITKLLFVIIFAALGFAQDQDTNKRQGSEFEVSYWQRGSQKSPWLFYTHKSGLVLDARFNLDEEGTAALCVGQEIGSEKFSIVPEFCGYQGQFAGYGPELWVLSETEKVSVTAYIQYARFLNTSSYGYAWFQSEYKLTKNVGIGAGGQALKWSKDKTEVDLGPSLKIWLGKWYINVVPAFRVTPLDRGKLTPVFGLGYTFGGR
jgi:hypothetical protein